MFQRCEVCTVSIIRVIITTLMMEAVYISETSVNFNVTTQHDIPEDSKLHIRCHEDLKSHMNIRVSDDELYYYISHKSSFYFLCLHIEIFLFIPQPKLTMARCRRNVDNFLEACRKIGVEEVGANGHYSSVMSMLLVA
jgi:hypothetical protein